MTEAMDTHTGGQKGTFEEVLGEVMAECGVETLEELHQRYLKVGGEWDRERFVRHAREEDEFISREFFAPLRAALGLGDFELFRARDGTLRGRGPNWESYHLLVWAYGLHYGKRAEAH